MDKTLHLIVFSPGWLNEYAAAIKEEIESTTPRIAVTWWKKGFFGEDNKYLLNECIRKLHSFDGAIIVLGAESREAASAGTAAVSANVLIEIGACMARFGRKRVFLVAPKSGAVAVPTYFEQNNAIFLTYDDRAPAGPEAVADAARAIGERLGALGQSAYYSDLPAFGLAHGYLNNFVKPATLNVKEGAAVFAKSDTGGFLKGRRRRPFRDAALILAIPEDRIVDRTVTARHLRSIGLIEAVIAVKDGRDITFFTIPDFRRKERDTLYIVDAPTNLIASNDAIAKIEELWVDEAGGGAPAKEREKSEYEQLLERREIVSFVRYLGLLNESAGNVCTIEPVSVPSIEALQMEHIRAITG